MAKIEKNNKKNILLPTSGLVVVFCLILLMTNILVKWQISFRSITVTVGLIVYPFTFLITNYVNEIYGKAVCKKLVMTGLIFAVIPSLIFSTIQITIGSLLAYFVGQFHDVWAFNWWKNRTNGRFLWLRNNASTIVSQLFDTLIFVPVAFYGVLDNKTIFSIMYSEYPIKVAFALMGTAPLYIFVRLARRSRDDLNGK